jgi:hypothetical protein
MKKILENIKWWLIFWFTALVVLIAWWLIYATLNFPDLKTVSEWDTLTAESWNKVVEAINALKEESNTNLNTLTTNLNTLSWTVASITTTLPPTPNVDSQVSFGWRYYKILSGRNRINAITGCAGLWTGRRLPSTWELYYIYLNKASITSIRSDSAYWSCDVSWNYSDGDNDYYNYAMILSMSDGSWGSTNIPNNFSVVCLYD